MGVRRLAARTRFTYRPPLPAHISVAVEKNATACFGCS